MHRESVNIGVIGAGFRGLNTLASRIAESADETGLRITALCDRRPEQLSQGCEYLERRFAARGIQCRPEAFATWESLLEHGGVDAVMVTTPQCAHRDPAVAAIREGLTVYVDKPLAHTLEDADAILGAAEDAGKPIMLGFTRRYEAPWRQAFELLSDGIIGPLHMIIIRDVIPFHTFFHRWHRRRKWSGGALNDKSSHHCDVLNWFAGGSVTRLSAVGGRRVFLPRDDAPERCLVCDDSDCPYRVRPTRGQVVSQEEMQIQDADVLQGQTEFERVDTCVYLPGADIKDHAMVQVAYDNGVVGSLIVSFFGPKAADQETMELIGTSGSITLTRHTGELRVISDHGQTVETIDCRTEDFKSSHFGADDELVREFRRFCDGDAPVVSAQEGYEATRMVMATHEAIDAGGATIDMTTYARKRC